MARLPRYGLPGQPQHVIQRGNNRAVLFATDTDYQFFRDCLTDAYTRHGCRVHAYVFMTNHVHLLMTPDHEDAIGKVMQSVGRRYVQYFNFTYQRTGTLWEGRYRATPIDTERYLLTCYRYIELNPIRAGIVDEPRNYRWSSHGCNAFGKADRLVTVHDQYAALGSTDSERQAAYRTLSASDSRSPRSMRSGRPPTRAGLLGATSSKRKSKVSFSAVHVLYQKEVYETESKPKRSSCDSNHSFNRV
jgi:putative transposase